MRIIAPYAVAVLAVTTALLARLLLQPTLGQQLPFAAIFLAVAFAAWMGGTGPALLAMFVGALAVVLWVIEPGWQGLMNNPQYQLALLLYAVVCVATIAMFRSMTKARLRVQALQWQGEQEAASRRRAEAELRRSEHFFKRITEVTPGVIYVFDLERQAPVFTNRSIAGALGHLPEEVQAMGADAVTSLMHPDDVPRFMRHMAAVRAMEDDAFLEFEHRMRDRAGNWHWFHSRDAVFSRTSEGAVREIIGTSVEITAQIDAQAALRTSEDRYRALFDTLLDGYCMLERLPTPAAAADDSARGDPPSAPDDYRFLEANLAFETHTGLVGVRGRRVREAAPLMEPFWFDIFAAVVRTGEQARLENHSQPLGRIFDVRVHRIGGAGSQTIGVLFTDISDRKQAELALRQNAALFFKLVDQAPTGMYVVDAGFRVQQVNALAEPVFRRVDPVIGRDFAEVASLLWGSDTGARVAAIFRRTLATGHRYVSPPFSEQRHDVHDGVAYDWEIQRVTLSSGEHGVVCYFHEVTERQRADRALLQSEERVRLATDATGVGIWEWNLATGQVHWNAQMFRLYGIEPTEAGFVRYADWTGCVLPEDLADQERVLQETVSRFGRSGREFRIRRRSDGELRHIQAAETVRLDSEGQAAWVLGTNLDITERAQLEARLKDSNQQKDEFLATLAHELRNPLAPVRHALELMKRGANDAALVEKSRATMARQITHMVRLIDDLLDISRITRNRLELVPERAELAPILQHAVEACRPLCEQAGHTLHVRWPDAPLALWADRTRLAQVFSNLLGNACKYTPAGGAIWLEADQSGGEVTVTVRDTGIGIEADMLRKVFDMFTQVDRSLERADGGLGIGLSLAMRLVEMHGGTIAAHSEGAGRGSRFVVRLPLLADLQAPQLGLAGPEGLAAAQPAPGAPAVPAPLSGPRSGPLKRQRRVLVVDDRRESADSLAMLLQMEGDETTTAYDGAEAVQRAGEFRPDIVLLDIGMPRMNGYNACRAIRAAPGGGGITIIALTGWGQADDRRQSREAGFDGHLVKPVDFDDLRALLARQKPLVEH
jgi:PAS domain S-box-containing protein